jgi:hypothetical protein
MAYTEAWLLDNTAQRCVLAKITRYNVISTAEETVYIGTHGYLTTSADVMFLPAIIGGLQFSENLTIDASPSMSFGSLVINNRDGSYDSWVDSSQYVWVNRSIKLYYGDPTWTTTDLTDLEATFELIFDGLISDIAARDSDTLAFKLRDKLERLNAPLTESKLGTFGTWDSQSNQDAIKPLVFGEVHNFTPLQIDPAELQYQVCAENAELLIEVRDNGVPVYTSGSTSATGATVTNSTATVGGTTFKLLASPAGEITCSVQGVAKHIDLTDGSVSTTYSNVIASLIALIVTQYGKSYTRLSASDLDLTNLAAHATANTQSVGTIVRDRANVIVVCQELAAAVGSQIHFTRDGKLQLLTLGEYTGDPVIDITESDIMAGSLSLSNRTGVIAAAKLGYCRNWSPQRGLVSGIPQDHKDLFAEEWLTVTSTIATSVQTTYKLTAEPVQKNTLLIVTSEAQAEADRLKTYFSVPRNVYSFTGTPRMQLLKLGQEVTLTHSRYGLTGGVTGQVMSLSPNWGTGLVDVEVIV